MSCGNKAETAFQWKDYGSYQELIVGSSRSVTLERRPEYCIRGRFVANVHGFVVDAFEFWPRYYFDEARAKLEIDEWLKLRMEPLLGPVTPPYRKPITRRKVT